ncbi:MAG TPA: DUF3313 domain-containing protein [Verrucomicrobiae bacterium]|nr:DUF3313 domain-containing protein [Verrucomicrobiae bacterium]
MDDSNQPGCQKNLPTVLAFILLLGLSACSTTSETRSVDESGFLKDYSQLKPGADAKLVYIDSSVNWNKFKTVYIEPIELWQSDDPKSKLGRLDEADKQMLVSYFYTALVDNVGKDFHLVNQTGPGVLIIHAAITEAKKSRPVANLASTVIPYGMAVSMADKVVFGKGVGVGEAQVEGEFLDGQTGERLAAVVDRRVGTKALRSKFDGTWGDVKQAMDYWSAHLDQHMLQMRDNSQNKKTDF